MIAHDHERVNAPAKPRTRLHEARFERRGGSFGGEHAPSIVASVARSAEFQPQFSGHCGAETDAPLIHKLSITQIAVGSAVWRSHLSRVHTGPLRGWPERSRLLRHSQANLRPGKDHFSTRTLRRPGRRGYIIAPTAQMQIPQADPSGSPAAHVYLLLRRGAVSTVTLLRGSGT